jgi:hypothetical protein
VYHLTGGNIPPHNANVPCNIFPDFGAKLHSYTRSFGPDNYKVCLEYMMRHDNLSLYDGGEMHRGVRTNAV